MSSEFPRTTKDIAWANGLYVSRWFSSAVLPVLSACGDDVLPSVLGSFGDIAQRAQEVAEAEYRRLGSLSGTGDEDTSVCADDAQDAGAAFYETMTGLRQGIVNLFAAGLFHLLEQQLACLSEDALFTDAPLNRRNMFAIADWYRDALGVDLRALDQWGAVNELRLVANTIKHADGRSAEELREKRPELFQNPILAGFHVHDWMKHVELPLESPLAGDGLYVTDAAFRDYAVAVNGFVDGIASAFTKMGREAERIAFDLNAAGGTKIA